MTKYNKLEIIGFVLLVIGAIWKVLEKVVDNELILKFSSYAQIIFFLGLFLWALGHMQKEKINKK